MQNFITSIVITFFGIILSVLVAGIIKTQKLPEVSYSFPDNESFPIEYSHEMLLVDPTKIPEPDEFEVPKNMQTKPIWQR